MKLNFMDVIMCVEFLLQTYLRYVLQKGSDRMQKKIIFNTMILNNAVYYKVICLCQWLVSNFTKLCPQLDRL